MTTNSNNKDNSNNLSIYLIFLIKFNIPANWGHKIILKKPYIILFTSDHNNYNTMTL